MNLPRNPALTIATALLGAALALPAAADLDGAGDAASPVRAPHKVANRFHHQSKARETAEFARLEVTTDEEMLELALIENIQREHLNPIEVAHAYKRLVDECHLSQEDIAQKVGKDRSTVTNFLRLLKLPAKVQDGLRKGKMSMGHARALVTLESDKTQLRLYEKIVSEGLSVRKVEDLVRGAGAPSNGKKKRVIATTPAGIQSVEEQLRQSLGTKVMVRSKGGGKGEIVVEFYSLDEFDRLLDLLTSPSKYR